MKSNQQKKNKLLLPIIAMAFVPLVMYYHLFDTKMDSYPWFGGAMQIDVFLYFKMVLIILLSVCMLLMIIGFAYKRMSSKATEKKKKILFERFYEYKAWIPIWLYAVLSLLSTIFSKYTYWGYHGISQQMEPVWVLLGYVIMAYYTYLFVKDKQDLVTLLKWMLIPTAILALIGAFQAFGLDFYKSTIGKLTYLPTSMLKEEIEFVFEKGRTYTSLYNPNYVGVYVSLFVPLLLVLIFQCRNLKLLAFYGSVLLLLIISLFGSGSKSGMLCIAVSMILLALFYWKEIIKKWKWALAGIAAVVLIFFGINALKGNALIGSIKNAMTSTKSEQPALTSIETNDDNVTIEYKGNTLVVSYNPEGSTPEEMFPVMDGNGEKIEVSQVDDVTIALQDERFPGFTINLASYQDIYFFDIKIDGKEWYFTNQSGDNTYYYLTITGKLDKIETAEVSSLFKGRETFASNRGFIWSRTIPLLKQYILLGSGADSFYLVYPNDEYVGKYNYGYGDQNISKPHNLYLQIGVQTGVVSLLAFLIFYLLYFVQCMRLYLKTGMKTIEVQLGAAILTGTFAYMLMGLANDSTVAVAQIFWIFMGIGMAINFMVRKNVEEVK
ncbi:MAG: hypothetical protein PWP24_1000 [Clostridiales bacterium]|nr:hypothetical protein [Clostridiales bacterium]